MRPLNSNGRFLFNQSSCCSQHAGFCNSRHIIRPPDVCCAYVYCQLKASWLCENWAASSSREGSFSQSVRLVFCQYTGAGGCVCNANVCFHKASPSRGTHAQKQQGVHAPAFDRGLNLNRRRPFIKTFFIPRLLSWELMTLSRDGPPFYTSPSSNGVALVYLM